MPANLQCLLEPQIRRLRDGIEYARASKLEAERVLLESEKLISANLSKIEALEDLLLVAESNTDSEPKLRPTEAIYRLIEVNGGATRQQIIALADSVHTNSTNKRHCLATTLATLHRDGKLIVDEQGIYQRATPTEPATDVASQTAIE